MDGQKLYLFGNGFDIAHGIHTTYSAFREFLREKYESFLTSFEAVYNIQPLDDTEPWYTDEAQKRWEKRVYKDLWTTFEDEIGKPDVEGMYDEAASLVESMPTDGVIDTLDAYWKEQYGFADDLQEYVLEWLEQIDMSNLVCKKNSLMNAQSDYFINFNYTDTLEKVYGIKNVFHPHGGISSCSRVAPIMGHGNRYLINSYRIKAKQAQEEFVEWYESICNAIGDYCQSLYKDTEKIIRDNDNFFESIECVDQVICLGLSFGDVDIPYLEAVRDAVKQDTKWLIYYYGEESKRRLKDVFGILGITLRFETYFLSSDKFWD